MLSDTHPEAEKVQTELIRRMSVAERLARMRAWTRTLVHLSREGIARANPGLDERELDLLWVEHHYGPDLAAKLRAYLEKRQSCKAATP
jgi:PP-loop superfamily ATP-utilizing enzyme